MTTLCHCSISSCEFNLLMATLLHQGPPAECCLLPFLQNYSWITQYEQWKITHCTTGLLIPQLPMFLVMPEHVLVVGSSNRSLSGLLWTCRDFVTTLILFVTIVRWFPVIFAMFAQLRGAMLAGSADVGCVWNQWEGQSTVATWLFKFQRLDLFFQYIFTDQSFSHPD